MIVIIVSGLAFGLQGREVPTTIWISTTMITFLYNFNKFFHISAIIPLL